VELVLIWLIVGGLFGWWGSSLSRNRARGGTVGFLLGFLLGFFLGLSASSSSRFCRRTRRRSGSGKRHGVQNVAASPPV
jgi:hypothetical protein